MVGRVIKAIAQHSAYKGETMHRSWSFGNWSIGVDTFTALLFGIHYVGGEAPYKELDVWIGPVSFYVMYVKECKD